MKISRRLAVGASLLALLCAPNVSAEAEALTDTQIEIIRQNCTSAQSSMQRLELNEAVTRRNRGVSYESTLKLMAALNGRIAYNKLTDPTLASLTAEVEKKRSQFVGDYKNYNNSYNVAMRLPNCREQPVTFYGYLTQTRELRTKLVTNIDDIDRLLDAYQQALNDLKSSVGGSSEPGSSQ